jgi:hypothetical protein
MNAPTPAPMRRYAAILEGQEWGRSTRGSDGGPANRSIAAGSGAGLFFGKCILGRSSEAAECLVGEIPLTQVGTRWVVTSHPGKGLDRLRVSRRTWLETRRGCRAGRI